MPAQKTVFLRSPSEIRKTIKGLQGSKTMDLAVAFVGADWWELLADFRGKLRLVCWLSSTNTDPRAVEDLMSRPKTEARQRDSMHCKIYLSPKLGAVVGSANLSKAALSHDDTSGQDEAAVLVTAPPVLSDIEDWFKWLWRDNGTRSIKRSDLAAAKDAWERARKARLKSGVGSKWQYNRDQTVAIPPISTDLPPEILAYASRVRSLDLQEDIGEENAFVGAIQPARLTKGKRRDLVDYIVSWTRHRSSYDNFLAQPIARVRAGLSLLFDESCDIRSRLEEVQAQGYLAGLRMPSLSLLLYWRNPEHLPPYNFRTVKFLRAFDLERQGMSASSPRCYVTWLGWATRFAQQLKLPTPGHVDRMVERYYEDNYARS